VGWGWRLEKRPSRGLEETRNVEKNVKKIKIKRQPGHKWAGPLDVLEKKFNL